MGGAKEYGYCSVCKHLIALKKDGTVWNHGICKICKGAGLKPAPAWGTQAIVRKEGKK